MAIEVYLYTGGPIPISWTPFGELFSVIHGNDYYSVIILYSGNVQGYAFWISIPSLLQLDLLIWQTISVTVLKIKKVAEKLYLFIR